MKKIFLCIISLLIVIHFAACSNKDDVSYVGVNAEILEISSQLNGMVVKGLDSDSILGEKCYINCENPDIYFLYVDNTSGDIKELTFENLSVGDVITVDIKKVEFNYAMTSRVQLMEQTK